MKLIVFLIWLVLFGLLVFGLSLLDGMGKQRKQECLDRGGFPISKGPRTFDYNCFRENPLMMEEGK